MASLLFDVVGPCCGEFIGQILTRLTYERLLEKQAEELRTSYTFDDLQENWEFKILRVNRGDFASSRFRQQVLDTESKAGWTFVEKFDSSKIRLKRPANAKANDHLVDFDPYRTRFAVEENAKIRFAPLGLVAVVCLTIITIYLYTP